VPAEPTILPRIEADPGLRAWLRTPESALGLAFGILYWIVGGLLTSLLGWILRYLLPRKWGMAVGRTMIQWAFRIFVAYLERTKLVHVDLSSIEPLRSARGPLILAPNHASLWDAVFLLTILPRPVCIMKKQILYNPLLGGSANLAGHIPGSNGAKMIHAAVNSLHDGNQLLLFPEGTRTRPESRWINPLKGGIALIAGHANLPVYPVFIRNDSRYLEKGWPPWKRPDFPIHISFELGKPIHRSPDEPTHAFLARLQSICEKELSRPHPLRRKARK
jgi:1-acyl-sn-glycerol-3-phosphate acyltransferase